MIYRMRIYSGVGATVDRFDAFFLSHLLPVQLKHGARLVGRWRTEDDRIVAIWAYANRAEYQRIEAAVRDDPLTRDARAVRATLPRLFETMTETFMVPSPDLPVTVER